jgi:hypothetical protein
MQFEIELFYLSVIKENTKKNCSETGMIFYFGYEEVCIQTIHDFERSLLFKKINDKVFVITEQDLAIKFISSKNGDPSEMR